MSVINGLIESLKNAKVAAGVDFAVSRGKGAIEGLRTFGNQSFLRTSDMLEHLSQLGENAPGVKEKLSHVIEAVTKSENKILGETRGGGMFDGSSQYVPLPHASVVERLGASRGADGSLTKPAVMGPGSARLPGSGRSPYMPQTVNIRDAAQSSGMTTDRFVRRAERARVRTAVTQKNKFIDKMLNDYDVSGSGVPYKEGSKVKTEPLGLKKGHFPVSDGFVGPVVPSSGEMRGKAAGVAGAAIDKAKSTFSNVGEMAKRTWGAASLGGLAGHTLAGGLTGGVVSGLTTAVNYALDGDKNQGPGFVKSVGMGMALGATNHAGISIAKGLGKSLTFPQRTVTTGALAMAAGGYAIAGGNVKTRAINS